MYPIRTILHPTDFSEDSAEAFRVACALARDYHARVVVLTVEPPEVVHSGFIARPSPDLYKEELAERLRGLTQAVPSLEFETVLVRGDPAVEILRVAAETNCDLIVMGTRGQSGIERLLMGSVAQAVLRGAACPVLTAKARRGESPVVHPASRASASTPAAQAV